MASSKGKEMTAVVSIAGVISPSLGKSIASAQKSLSGFGASLASIGLLGVGTVAVAGIAAIGTAAAGATALLGKMGEEWKKSQNIIRIGTGKTGDDLGKLEKTFENIYSKFEGSKELIAQTVADANTLTDVEGKALENYAMNVLDAADMLKIDTGALLKSTSAVFKAFNIEGNEMAAMTDYIFKAGQTTGVGMDQLSETVLSSASSFKALGMDFKSSIAMVGQLTKEGVEVESVIAGMKKAIVNLNKIDKKTGKSLFKNPQEALKGFIGKIKDAKTENEAMAISMKVFGSKAGNVMATGIRSGKIAVEALVKQLDASKETIDKVGNDTELASDKMVQMWHRAELALKPLSGFIYSQFDRVAAKLMDVQGKISPVFQKSLDGIKKYVEKAADWAVKWIETIDTDKLAEQLDRFAESAKNIFNQTKKAFGYVLDNSDTIIGYIKAIGAAYLIYKGIVIAMTAAQWALNAATVAIKIGTVAWTAAQWALNVAMTANPIGIIIVAIAALVAGIVLLIVYWDEVIAAIRNVDTWLTEKMGAWKYLIYALGGPVIALTALIINNWDSIKNFLSGVWEWIKNKWNELMNWFSGCGKIFGEIGDKIANGLKEGFVKFKDFAIEIIEGLGKKITAVFDNVKNFASNLNPFSSKNDNPLPAYAAGGFTKGLSICGEAGTEAVISFDPSHRSENQGYVMQAAEMLGMVSPASSASPGRQSVINIGGVTFSPTINKTGGSGSDQSILAQLEACFPDFMDKIEEALAERGRRRYV